MTNVSGSAWRILRSRDFGPYFVGNAASASGTWFQNLAAAILVYRLTHSALYLGILNACQFGPVLLLSPWTGRVADGFDRRRLLLFTQSTAACLSAALATLIAAGHADTWTVIGFSAALGVMTAFSNPAQMALVGSLVPRADLAQAVALNSMTFNIARAVGPAAASLVIAAFGVAPAIAVNSCSYLLLVGGLLVVHPTPVKRTRRSSIRESVAIVRRQPQLLGLLAIVAAVSIAGDPVNAQSPAIVHAFGLTPVWAGTIVGCFGAGAVAAAILVSGRIAGSRRRIGGTLALFGGSIMLMAASPWFALALVFLFFAGFGSLSSNAGATARIQLSVRESERGRIMALWSVAWMGIRPVTSLIDGALAEFAGIRVAAPVMALPALAGGLYLFFHSSQAARLAEAGVAPAMDDGVGGTPRTPTPSPTEPQPTPAGRAGTR